MGPARAYTLLQVQRRGQGMADHKTMPLQMVHYDSWAMEEQHDTACSQWCWHRMDFFKRELEFEDFSGLTL